MKKGTYIGKVEHLVGKEALIRGDGAMVLAQFDEFTLTRSGEPLIDGDDGPPEDCLAFGWHLFSATDFELRELSGAKPK